jgi:bacteriocin biosynthesis cyclodehydratase domain-containing protein
MRDVLTRKPRLAFPFTILRDQDKVRLVAGEDFRYLLTGPEIDRWLPDFLRRLDGRRPLAELLNGLEEGLRAKALELLERLYGERVLVDGPTDTAHRPGRYRPAVEGTGPLAEELASPPAMGEEGTTPVPVLCQDRLDYQAALDFNRRCLIGDSPWLWVTCGPMNRGYVSPPFLPDAGPCLACLLRHFQRLSPVPEVYDALREHARQGRPIEAVPFPSEATAILARLALWKLSLLGQEEPPAALYRLHVLEVDSLEVTAHRVFVDPECPDCGPTRR